jgi:segregation and condensation protein B
MKAPMDMIGPAIAIETEITSATQSNTATGPATIAIDQINAISTHQRSDVRNTCGEIDGGINDAVCFNDVDNIIGPLDQSNDATGTETESFDQVNNFGAAQHAAAENDCDESGLGDNLADCESGDSQGENTIDGVSQDNIANGEDDASFIQTNDAPSFIQAFDLENDCNESEDGNNDVSCIMDYVADESINLVGPVNQFNEATGSGSAAIWQNNEIDGDDAADIPGVNQVVVADNSCDEAGPGTNFAVCDLESENIIDSITQDNVVIGASESTVTFQDNRAVISQVVGNENDCDETSTGAGNNEASCISDNFVDNFIGPLDQDNLLTGADNSLFDQDNNIAVSQDLLAENNCDGTGTSTVSCENEGGDFEINRIDSITQDNDADNSGNAFSNQENTVSVDQNAGLINTCDETGTGNNGANCLNDGLVDGVNFVGPLSQSNSATGEEEATIAQANQIDITQNLGAVNDCDESGSGDNFAICENEASNFISSITQTNTGVASGDDSVSQVIFVGINQNLQTKNDCDESGGGNNEKECTITSSNEIGNIVQTNDATATDSANILSISQDLNAENNCDDTTEGSNTGRCTIDLHLIVPDLEQINGEELTITQSDSIVNECEGGASCSASRTVTFVPSAPLTTTATPTSTTSLASVSSDSVDETTSEEGDGEGDERNQEEGSTQPLALAAFSESSVQEEEASSNDGDEGNDDENNNNNDDVSELTTTDETGDEGDEGDEGDTHTNSARNEDDEEEDAGDERDDEQEEEDNSSARSEDNDEEEVEDESDEENDDEQEQEQEQEDEGDEENEGDGEEE